MRWLLILLVACGGKSEPKRDGFGGACDRREREHLCVELWSQDHDTASAVKAGCDVAHGTVRTEKCPRTGAVGQCVGGRGTTTEIHTLFYPPLGKLSVSELCQGPGAKAELF